MITHKSYFSPFPFEITLHWRKPFSSWYLLPQGCSSKNSVTELRYHSEVNVYKHISFWLPVEYTFYWLFLTVRIKVDITEQLSERLIRHQDAEADYQKALQFINSHATPFFDHKQEKFFTEKDVLKMLEITTGKKNEQ